MKKFELFPTTIMEFDFTGHSDIKHLIKIINQNPTAPHLLVKNGVSSHSMKNHILLSPNLKKLKNHFQKCVEHYSKEVKIQSTYINISWFNIMKNQGEVVAHNHGASIISGAFYPLLEKNSCNLYFKSPLTTSLNFIPEPHVSSDHFQEDFKMSIKPFHLYLFPGWLTHYTEKNRGNKRIVLSFNTKFY